METASHSNPTIASPSQPTGTVDEVEALRAEVARLRALVGPSEASYRKLHLDLLGARDHAIAAEAHVGHLRGQIVALDSENYRLRRSARYALDVLLVRLLGPGAMELVRPVALPVVRAIRVVRRAVPTGPR